MKDPQSEISLALIELGKSASHRSTTLSDMARDCAVPVSVLKTCIDAMVSYVDEQASKSYSCEDSYIEPNKPAVCDEIDAKAKSSVVIRRLTQVDSISLMRA